MRSVSTENNAYYKCKVSYNTGSLVGTSSNFAQYVQNIYNNSPTTYTFAGQSVSLTCKANGGPASITWQHVANGSSVDFTNNIRYTETLTAHSGLSMASMVTITELAIADSPISYRCTVAYNSGDTLTSVYVVNVLGKKYPSRNERLLVL